MLIIDCRCCHRNTQSLIQLFWIQTACRISVQMAIPKSTVCLDFPSVPVNDPTMKGSMHASSKSVNGVKFFGSVLKIHVWHKNKWIGIHRNGILNFHKLTCNISKVLYIFKSTSLKKTSNDVCSHVYHTTEGTVEVVISLVVRAVYFWRMLKDFPLIKFLPTYWMCFLTLFYCFSNINELFIILLCLPLGL